MKLKEYTFSVPNADKHLNVSREQLPQIPSKKMPEFLAYLKANKVPFGKKKCIPSKLKPVQKHINKEKVKTLTTTDKDSLNKPIIIDRNNYVIDGHHRWIAWIELYGDKPMTVIFIDDDVPGLVKIANNFEHSTSKKIDEGGPGSGPQKEGSDSIASLDFMHRKHIGEDPKTPENVLHKLAKDDHDMVRLGVAKNKKCSKEILNSLVDDKVPNVRAFVAMNPNATEEILQQLMKDKDPRVVNAVKKNYMAQLKKSKSQRSKVETFEDFIQKKVMKEFDYSVTHLYDPANYNDPQTAYKELQKLNTKLNKTKKITMKQVQNFLRNVYKSGDHQVSKKDFIRTLLDDNVKIVNRSDRLCPSGYSSKDMKESIKIEVIKMLREATNQKQTDEEWIKEFAKAIGATNISKSKITNDRLSTSQWHMNVDRNKVKIDLYRGTNKTFYTFYCNGRRYENSFGSDSATKEGMQVAKLIKRNT